MEIVLEGRKGEGRRENFEIERKGMKERDREGKIPLHTEKTAWYYKYTHTDSNALENTFF